MISRFIAKILSEGDVEGIPTTELDNNTVQTGLEIFFGIAAAVALLIVAISALKMVIARGNPDDFTKARNSVIYSVVGLIITMSAYLIVAFVVESV